LTNQVESKMSNYETVYMKSPNIYNQLDKRQKHNEHRESKYEVAHQVEKIYDNGIYISTKINGEVTQHFAASAPPPTYEECPPKNQGPPVYPRIARTASNTLIEIPDNDELIRMHQKTMDRKKIVLQ